MVFFFFCLALSAEHLSPTGHRWSQHGIRTSGGGEREGGSARSELVLPSDGEGTEVGEGGEASLVKAAQEKYTESSFIVVRWCRPPATTFLFPTGDYIFFPLPFILFFFGHLGGTVKRRPTDDALW